MNGQLLPNDTDTIVAIATPLGVSPRAICRLSGPEAVALARQVFESEGAFPRHTATFAAVTGEVRVVLRPQTSELLETSELLRLSPPSPRAASKAHSPQPEPRTPNPEPSSAVPATLYLMRAPRSYTREDVAELHVPGSPPIIAALVEALVRAGARPAGPGEFTRRAFLNGRIDLAQAEAVLGVIRAADDEQLRSALAGLGAAASRHIGTIAESLDRLAALVELGIDFSEEDLDPVPPEQIAGALSEAIRSLEPVAAAGVEALQAEAVVALVGAPNSGKSSLFNALVGRSRSIVSHVAGTTRDVVTAPLAVGPWRLTLADTAGGPTAGDSLAAAAWAVSRKQAGASHLLLVVIDRSRRLSSDVLAGLDEVTGQAPVVVALNKSDLPARTTHDDVAQWRPGAAHVETSALTGEGLDGLRSAVAGAFASARVRVGSEGLLLPARQAQAASRALESVRQARDLWETGDRPELVALEIRAARRHLDAITGRGSAAAADSVLDLVFSQFCIGK